MWEYFDISASTRMRVRARQPDDARLAGGLRGRAALLVEHIFRGKRDDRRRVVHASETRPLAELAGESSANDSELANGNARERPVTRGDRVVAYDDIRRGPRRSSRCASIGAVWSSCSPDFGVRSGDRQPASRRSSRRFC